MAGVDQGPDGVGSTQTLIALGGGNMAWECTQVDKSDARWIETLPGMWSPTSNSAFEFRLKVVAQPDPTSEVFEIWCCDGVLHPGKWECRAFYFGATYIVEASSSARENQSNKVMFDTSTDFKTYRVEYASGTARLYYRNGNAWTLLLTSSVGRTFDDMIPSGLQIGDGQPWTGAGTWQLDYIGFGKECTKVLKADVNQDCKVNLADMAQIAKNWMRCFDPAVSSCEKPWLN
jgi:hypothetical protein